MNFSIFFSLKILVRGVLIFLFGFLNVGDGTSGDGLRIFLT